MMQGVVSNDALRLVEVVTARVQITIKAGKVTARDLNTNAMTGFEVIAGHHWSKRHLVDLAVFHPDFRFVISVAIAHALNRLVEIVRTTIRINVDQLDSEIGDLRIGRDKERHFDWPADFKTFLQRPGTVNKDILTR